MKQQPEYQMKGDAVNPALNALKMYTITTAAIDNDIQEKIVDQVLEANALLSAMTYDLQCSILKAMGIAVKDAEPGIVKATLFRKVTDDKNLLVPGTSKKNIDMFLELAKADTATINLRGIVTMAREYGIISKNKNGIYRYGEIELGRTIAEVNKFLGEKDNYDVLNRVTDELRTKGVSV